MVNGLARSNSVGMTNAAAMIIDDHVVAFARPLRGGPARSRSEQADGANQDEGGNKTCTLASNARLRKFGETSGGGLPR